MAVLNETLTAEECELLDGTIDRYRDVRGGLIPVLQTVQQTFGYLSTPVIERIAERLSIPLSEVTGVITFYSYFTTTPRGDHTLRVCLGTACYVRSGKQVLEDLEKTLSITVGETTPDRCFSLEVGRCFGACGLAPVVMIDDDVHQRVKSTKLRELLEPYGHSGADAKSVREDTHERS